jgi:hypothetical protein
LQVNQYTPNRQILPTISHDSSGGFVVAWSSQEGSAYAVFARRFDSSGGALGDEFRVNNTTNGQFLPVISHDSSGGFVVAWESLGQDGSNEGVFARRFDSSGGALGDEFQVNQYTTSAQFWPTISHDSSGDFVVAWHSVGQDGSGYGVFARGFNSSGSASGDEFQVNEHTTSVQGFPTISHDSSGRFVVAWHSFGQDGPSFGVFARRIPGSTVATGPAAGGTSLVRRYEGD